MPDPRQVHQNILAQAEELTVSRAAMNGAEKREFDAALKAVRDGSEDSSDYETIRDLYEIYCS